MDAYQSFARIESNHVASTAYPKAAAEIAKASGGKVIATRDLAAWIDKIPAPEMSRVVAREMDLWDTPLLYLLLLVFLGIEWFLRRRENLL